MKKIVNCLNLEVKSSTNNHWFIYKTIEIEKKAENQTETDDFVKVKNDLLNLNMRKSYS